MSAQKELPIIFTGQNPAKIRAGTKTQTRRIIKPQPVGTIRRDVLAKTGFSDAHGTPVRFRYDVGMRLWVRETWRRDIFDDTKTIYRATHGDRTVFDKWLPSIHMPRTRCRTLLEVVSVRAERLQDISEADAVAEGVGKTIWTMTKPIREHQLTVRTQKDPSRLIGANGTRFLNSASLMWWSQNPKPNNSAPKSQH